MTRRVILGQDNTGPISCCGSTASLWVIVQVAASSDDLKKVSEYNSYHDHNLYLIIFFNVSMNHKN